MLPPTTRFDATGASPKGRVLILSSWCAVGHVGLSAGASALQALGYEVTQLPSMVLSNHKGWPHWAGAPLATEQLRKMLDAIEDNGWLDDHHAALIGYLPSVGHVEFARELLDRLRQTSHPPLVVVDPILGDTPKGLYVSADVAAAVRDHLVPLADILTPNLFELGWITGRRASTLEEARTVAAALRRDAGAERILLTSPPLSGAETGVLEIGPNGMTLHRTRLLPEVPHGAGDVFAALVAAGLPTEAALERLYGLLERSVCARHLDIVGAFESWKRASDAPGGPRSVSAGE